MKFYVASSSSNLEKVREAMAFVRSKGHEISCDWTQHVQALNEGRLEVPSWLICRQDIYGVQEAAAVIYLHTEKPSDGAWFELGLAVGKGIPVAAIIGIQTAATRKALLDRFLFLNCERFPTLDQSRFVLYASLEDYFAQFNPTGQGFQVGDDVRITGGAVRYRISGFNSKDYTETHASLRSGCTGCWAPVSKLRRWEK